MPKDLFDKGEDRLSHVSETSSPVKSFIELPQPTSAPVESDTAPAPTQPPWTVLRENEIKSFLIVAAFAAAVSPFSTSTYYPSVVAISRHLGVSVSRINLTISTYQIFQGIAPTFIAAFADMYGRRPAYLLCFVIYFGANLGLALQNSYAALLVLRCVQSSGSSGTATLAQAVTADVTTRAERGKYLAYVVVGITMGPALGPVIGGLLAEFLGWRGIFWFLLILGTIICLIVLAFLPETARSIVGDGSIPSQCWNKSLLQMFSKKSPTRTPNPDSLERRRTNANPFTSLVILWNRENFLLCISGGLLYAGYASVTSVFASQLQELYGYNAVQVGLCYLPVAFGSLSGVGSSRIIDWNFKREARKQGLPVIKNRQQDISNFDTEKARLAFAFPVLLLSSCLVTAYGWQMQYHASLASILVTMFFISNFLTGTLISNTALLTDVNGEEVAAVGAATNLTRCLLSAGGVALIGPLIKAVGIGWAATITAGIWLCTGLAFGLVYVKGFEWRKEGQTKKERRTRSGIENGVAVPVQIASDQQRRNDGGS